MLSITIEDNAGQCSFSPDLNTNKYISSNYSIYNSSFLPIAFSSKDASSSSTANNIFQIAQYLSDFIRDYEYQSISVANNPGRGYGYTFGNKISFLKYSDGKEIAIITINKTFTLDQINQLSGFKVTSK
jgi:hypothetical protein